jgi:amidophosphoribosyltransferase
MTGTPLFTNPFDDDKLHEECGVFGIFGHTDAGALTVLGLHALQHRGQEAAGIVTYDGSQFIAERHPGLIGDIFGKNSDSAKKLKGSFALGHVRYSTTGGSVVRNIQPMFADLVGGGIALAHNGNLTNARTLRENLVREGAIFQSTSDTEVIIHLAARSHYGPIVDRLIDALKQVEGAYSLVALTSKKLIGVRDPWGVRPLVLGTLDGAPILASETCALDIIGADYVRDVEPGEVVVITKDGITSYHPFKQEPHRFCIFEYVYFARPDSMVEGRNVYEARKRIGEELAHEAPADADMIVPVPDSGVPAALGFASASGIPFELGIIRNHYVGRTFIEPSDRIRHLGVRLKHNPNRAKLQGKRIVLVDDSIVRGTTSKKIVQMVRDAGRRRSAFSHCEPADDAFLFLRRRYAERERPARASHGCGGDAALHSGRQPCIRFDEWSLSRDGRARTFGARAAILRCVFLRRLSHPPDRSGRA